MFTFMRPFRRGHIAIFVAYWADLARERECASQRRTQYKYPNMVKFKENPYYSIRHLTFPSRC